MREQVTNGAAGWIAVADRRIALDADGHLLDPTDWSPELALVLAAADGCELDADRWWLIKFARKHHARYDAPPLMRAAVHALRKVGGKENAGSRDLYYLFPDGPIRLACKYGGLPKPASCI